MNFFYLFVMCWLFVGNFKKRDYFMYVFYVEIKKYGNMLFVILRDFVLNGYNVCYE